jgi:hypothetical protein
VRNVAIVTRPNQQARHGRAGNHDASRRTRRNPSSTIRARLVLRRLARASVLRRSPRSTLSEMIFAPAPLRGTLGFGGSLILNAILCGALFGAFSTALRMHRIERSYNRQAHVLRPNSGG